MENMYCPYHPTTKALKLIRALLFVLKPDIAYYKKLIFYHQHYYSNIYR